MWDWIRLRRRIVWTGAADDAPAVVRHAGPVPGRTGKVAGKHAPLHTYLANRYADVVVLTFGQIEDLLGFALPDSARTRPEWWTTDTHVDNPPCSDAWILAGRTARPNLPAGIVAFERGL
jgi:hypothetical protein